jgi:hypothetical protein
MTKTTSTAPVELTEAQLDLVSGGLAPGLIPIEEQVNGGGNVPNGNANGVPEVLVAVVNKGGNLPTGQQP